MRIAIITASVGEGHNSVAASLQEALKNETPNSAIEIFDLLDDHKVYQLITQIYLELVAKKPSIYSKIFSWSQQHPNTTNFISYCNFLTLSYLKRIKRSFQAETFIFTHPIPASCYNYSLGIPAWTVITDYSYHPIWYNPKVTGYFVANNQIKNQLYRNNYPIQNIYTTGLPVKDSFIKSITEEIAPSKKPLILIMGGGLGIGPLKEIIEILNTIKLPFEALVLTGKNNQLYLDITKSIKNAEKDIKDIHNWTVLSYTNEIHSLMKKATLLITKAGGITLTEAMVSALPTVIYKPLPGHEEENAQFITQQGWASWAKNPEELISILSDLLISSEKLEMMKGKSLQFSQPMAANNIAQTILTNTFTPLLRKSQ